MEGRTPASKGAGREKTKSPLHQWSQVLNQQVLCHLQGRALRPSEGTPGSEHCEGADQRAGFILWTQSDCSSLSLLMSYPHPKQHTNELFSVTSRQIEKWEVPLEGLASTPQMLLGMSRKDSESENMFRSKPLALTGHPGIH